jgi:cell wall-associated NlpC family hydrolase
MEHGTSQVTHVTTFTRPLRPRQPNWDGRLVRWAKGLRGTPHLYGVSDCLTLVVGAVDAMTGTPLPLPADERKYTDAWGARKATKAAVRKYGSFAAALCAYGLVDVGGMTVARSGDVLVWETQHDTLLPATAIVVGRVVLLTAEDSGAYSVPLSQMLDDATVRVLRVP